MIIIKQKILLNYLFCYHASHKFIFYFSLQLQNVKYIEYMTYNKLMMLKNFDFKLPAELIAQHPLQRGQSRLLCWNGKSKMQNMLFENIYDLLQPEDVLILNNTKVIPACLYGTVNESLIRVNLISKVDNEIERWEVLSKPRKKLQLGTIIRFSPNLIGTVVEKFNHNNMDVIQFNLFQNDFFEEINTIGTMPLPPYIKRKATELDTLSYQTIFSKVNGSVAAPTAGLHFTEELLKKLKQKGIKIGYITLHVGGGTFLPIRVDSIHEHKMHYESYFISQEVCDLVNQAKANKRRVIAVGTTVLRTLESSAIFCQSNSLFAHSNSTNLFIKDSHDFKIVNGLITNFHLPKSTLFVLVCAYLNGVANGHKLYEYAIQNQYRFFSYGDACFLTRD